MSRKRETLERRGTGLKIFGAFVFFFLYFPLLIVILFSFSRLQTLGGNNSFTLKWYAELFKDRALMNAFFHSLAVGGIAVVFAIVFGTFGAFFIQRTEFPGKGIFRTLVMLPYLLPGIIVGLTLLIFIRKINIKLSMFTILLGHISFTTPLVMLQVLARLQRMGPNYEFAAMDLGANPVQTFFYVTLPMIKTAIIGGALLAFTTSFDEIVISYFLTGTWMTLPVYVYGMIRFGLSPKVYAVSGIVLCFSILIVVLMTRYTGEREEMVRVRKRRQIR
ncbi:MAG TPA: ABC transporter permease [Spirochaetia bacterium]|nr:ABC transporter permease [Spirochaetia bacterium]